MPDWIDGEIIENRGWTEELFSVRFCAPIASFRAGQFVRIGMDVDGEVVARPYSLVNSPAESVQEIFFNIVPQGPLTPRLASLRQGDVIKVGPKASGFLTIEEVPNARHLWMLATGTGLGPFISIIRSEQPWDRFEKVVLVYSVRHARDLAYQDVIAETCRQHRQLSFVPLVTRERLEGAMNTRITTALESGDLEREAGVRIGPEDSHVMMCGNSEMIADVTEVLKTRDMRKHLRREPGHITTEKYH